MMDGLMSESAHIETVFLDAGGVLVHPHWVRIAEALREEGVDVASAALLAAETAGRRAVDVPKANSDAGRGRLFFGEVLRTAGVAWGEPVERAMARLLGGKSASSLWDAVSEDAPLALARLREHAKRLVVVSNADGTARALLEQLGLAQLLDLVIDSFEEGVEKPDPRIFEIALHRSGATAETTVHVGDLYHVDVVGARAAGLRAILFDPAGLRTSADCPRVTSLSGLAKLLLRSEITWNGSRPGEVGID
jgi:FMN phosphatase YigB (HAD superfamily)